MIYNCASWIQLRFVNIIHFYDSLVWFTCMIHLWLIPSLKEISLSRSLSFIIIKPHNITHDLQSSIIIHHVVRSPILRWHWWGYLLSCVCWWWACTSLLLPRKSSSSSAPWPRRHYRAIYKAYIRWPYWALSSICTSCAKLVGFLLSSLSFIIYLCHFSGTEITSDAWCEKCKRATGPFIGECRKLEGYF